MEKRGEIVVAARNTEGPDSTILRKIEGKGRKESHHRMGGGPSGRKKMVCGRKNLVIPVRREKEEGGRGKHPSRGLPNGFESAESEKNKEDDPV